MSKKTGTIRVEALDEPGRYRVESWSNRKAAHLVDIFALRGNGECSCTDYKTRCFPNWKKNRETQGTESAAKLIRPYLLSGKAKANPNRTICKHIHAANWRYLLDIKPAIYEELHR